MASSSKDKDQAIQKFKQFFKQKKSGVAKDKNEQGLDPVLELNLRPETPVETRCRTLKELEDDVLNCPLQENVVPKLWELTKDLIVANKPAKQRHIALNFYCKLIQGQFKDLGAMRGHFFNVIENHEVPEDLQHRLELLKALTLNGKDIGYFEEKIGPLMIRWVQPITAANLTVPFLEMLICLIRFNTAYLDKNIIVEILHNACWMSCTIDDRNTVLQCLSVVDTVIRYAIFPNESLTIVIFALCRTVNCETYCHPSWQIMRNLLGTELGHAALLTMCNILNEQCLHHDAPLLRGAVFHINMGVWGSTSSAASTLRCTPSMVLNSFLHSLKSGHIIVTYEVTLSIQRLINNQAKDLSEPTWDVIIEILAEIAENNSKAGLTKDNDVQKHFHETLDTIEIMIKNLEISADPEIVYGLIGKVCEDRSEISVQNLIEYRSSRIKPTKPNWLHELHDFIDRFYKRMTNTKIRVYAIEALMEIMDENRATYEEEILDQVVMLFFGNIVNERDQTVRIAVAGMLINFSRHCETKRCIELFEIIEKVIMKQYDVHQPENFVYHSEEDIQDAMVLVEGLIKVFQVKLYRLPSSHAIYIYNMLINFIEQHYLRPKMFENTVAMRYQIFEWMLKARANASYHIGYPDNSNTPGGVIKYSPYLGIEHSLAPTAGTLSTQISQNSTQESPIPPASCTLIPIRRGCKLIVKCLELEKDWKILDLVLRELPKILQNKALIQGNDIDYLVRTLHKMYLDKKFIDTIPRQKPSITDLQQLLLPAIAAAATYHQFLDTKTQKKIVEVLKLGMCSRALKVCVHALTLLVLEITDVIIRLLPDVLYEMSKLSCTPQIAIPILEFLSTLNRLPNQRFANFVQRECMYTFAISLPYTNPYRYDHYTVSLAHHVVAGWFVKCRLSWRSDLVGFIIAGLESYIHLPLQEKHGRVDYSIDNEDSSNRKRSSSLTEQGSRRANPVMHAANSSGLLYEFHMELAETCIDFMARHTYSVSSALPRRMPVADFLLAGGQSTTWLVGHSLITVTTSGCALTPLKNGLCDKCYSVLPNHPLSKSESTASSALPTSPESSHSRNEPEYTGRRYTKASFQLSNTNESDSTDVTSSSSSTTPYNPNNQQDPKFFTRQSSQDGRFSSSGSLEVLSRRGSNPDAQSEGYESQKTDRSKSLHPYLAASMPNTERPRQVCACCCAGWAEICIRRPTGTMSWLTRIQNQLSYDSFTNEFSLQDLTSLFTPNNGGVINPNQLKAEVNRSNAELSKIFAKPNDGETKPKVSISDDVQEINRKMVRSEEFEIDDDQLFDQTQLGTASGPIDIPGHVTKRKSAEDEPFETDFDDANNPDVVFDDYDTRSRNPVRRVNSSPEMSSNYRHPFLSHKNSKDSTQSNVSSNSSQQSMLQTANSDDENSAEMQQKKKSNYGKDMRVSCEAIPEEMGGTPPSLTGSVTKDTNLPPPPPQQQIEKVVETNSKLLENENIAPRKQKSADEIEHQHTTEKPQAQLSLKIPMEMVTKVTAKPPQSPAPLSPRLLAKNSTNKFTSNSGTASPNFPAMGAHNQNEDMPRGRSKTISVTSREHYSRDSKWTGSRNALLSRSRDQPVTIPKCGISPSFVFLQLYHSGQLNATEKPIMVDPSMDVSINLLDLIAPFDTHCIGVLYVGPGQCNNETEILKNRCGSFRYTQFLCNLGTLVNIKEAKENNLFIQLEGNGKDGTFTYLWQDDIIQVCFHVATLMPNKEQDPQCNEKKKHIGNDFVTIVYNESGEEYNLNTIKCKCSYACVIVEPLELNSNRVYIRTKDEVRDFISHSEPKIVSDNCVSLLARQLALHANLASLVSNSLKTKNRSPYASNWLERLRKIKNIQTKLLNKNKDTPGNGSSSSRGTADLPNRFADVNNFILYTKPTDRT